MATIFDTVLEGPLEGQLPNPYVLMILNLPPEKKKIFSENLAWLCRLKERLGRKAEKYL